MQPPRTSTLEVLDRVLDKGIVIDAWVRVSLAGIDLVTIETRVIVASFEAYLSYADRLGGQPGRPRPPRRRSTPRRRIDSRRRDVTSRRVEQAKPPLGREILE